MNPSDLAEHLRVRTLIERFRAVDAAMRDLPLYNAKVPIEAIGFRHFGENSLLGVVQTPWFMNLIVLPVEPEPMDMTKIGKSDVIQLPAGPRTFIVGGDEVVGLYKAHSLHSPVLNFTLPGQAQAEARRLLAVLMTPPAPDPVAANKANKDVRGFDRRALFMGRGSA